MADRQADVQGRKRRYGGPWAEWRALMATSLVGLAMKVHFRATMDMASDLSALLDDEKARLAEPAREEDTCPRCGGAIVNPERHGEGWCIEQ